MRSVVTTIGMGQNMQMFTHSDVNKSICGRQTKHRFQKKTGSFITIIFIIIYLFILQQHYLQKEKK